METKELITVQQLPVIAEQLAALRADVLAQTGAAMKLECTEESRKAVKAARADLNRQYKELEARRIAVKKEILKPYDAFEQIYREQIGTLFTDADRKLAGKIAEVEDGMKGKLEADAAAYFREYAAFRGIPEDVLRWETAGIPVRLTDTPTKLRRAVQEKLDIVRGDLDCIAAMEDADEVRAEWNKPHSLPAAVATVKARKAAIEAERIRREAAEKAAMQARQEAEARAAELAAASMEQPAVVVQAAPASKPEPEEAAPASIFDAPEDPEPEGVAPWVVEVFAALRGTSDAIGALHAAADRLGITWEVLER